MVVCKEEKGLRFPCSEGFTGTLEKSVKSLDSGGIRFKKNKRR
ncbi:hypothetical protein LCGC14_0714700 [marine sediment metagenome]|uniref:Uncharacterized protein n=1 Tax=marine sediment metagenome TaxID=412755 RepID=A0A0F9QE21_9ZZZZ